MGGKKTYINIFGSFTEPFSCPTLWYWKRLGEGHTYIKIATSSYVITDERF